MSRFKILLIVAVIFSGIAAVDYNKDKLFEISKNIEIYVNVYKELNSNYVDDIDPSELMRTGIDAMVSSLDPYTNYISESQIESYRISTDGKYQGIGAVLKEIDKNITVVEPYLGGSAMKAGLIAGDQIIAINGQTTLGKSLEDINAIIRGVPGTDVNIKVHRPSQNNNFDVTLTRDEVNIPNVPYFGEVGSDIGYINLTTFTPNAAKNIKSALRKLKKENPSLQGVILDLRYNGGGLLREAIDICNLFVPKGEEVVTTKSKVGERDQSYRTRSTPEDLDINLAVLINKRSASASEIVSGVIQDLDRGILIGQRSFGKGLVQNTKEVGYNSRLKVTISKYYVPSGRCIQGVEYENGEPVDIPDDQRSKFKTRNGRTVLDGGGVTPDVKMDPTKLSSYTQALLDNHVIFKFVNDYVSKFDSIEAAGDYQFTDYDTFKKFVQESGYNYRAPEQKVLESLIETSDTETSSASLKEEISALSVKIEALNADNLDKYQEEITNALEIEIITRYYHQEGKVKHRLSNDPEVQEAIRLLNDQAEYKKILS